MRIGILADIHEEVDYLKAALDRLDTRRVDRLVVLGDVFDTGRRIEETCRLLADAGAIGVWGNHDFGLCHEPEPATRDKYAGVVLDFMATLQPRLELEGCLFSHIEPWLDPTNLLDLWHFDGLPETADKAAASFTAVRHEAIFVGHFHKWLIATPAGGLLWGGGEPVCLWPGERYLVAIAAVRDGRCALFDTVSRELAPFDVRPPGRKRHRLLHSSSTRDR